jgi:hypothetical protein
VRALYRGAPTQADLDEFGLTVDDEMCASPNSDGWYYDKGANDWRCILWSENWPAIKFYVDIMSTQWRHGFNGPTGLDYNVLLHELDRRRLEPDEYDDLFGSIRTIESEALNEMRPKQ